MAQDTKRSFPVAAVLLVSFLLAVACAAAWMTGLWVLTAIPIGFLFGFFLQKGDLCGASAFSEVLVMKDGRKIWGIWVAIVTGMAGFAVLDLLGWVALNPKPFLWANLLVGGILFGAGMVLAGGCISGSLYKAGSGHINSIVALAGIPIGIALVEYGPLSRLSATLKTHAVQAADGGSLTLSSLTGLPFWAVAGVMVAGTLAAARYRTAKSVFSGGADSGGFSLSRALCAKAWRPWQAGLLIGILGSAAYLSSAASGRNYPLGVTHGVVHAQLLATDSNLNFVYQPQPAPASDGPASVPGQPVSSGRKVSVWLIALVASLVAGSWFAARLSGQTRLIAKPPEQILVALIGSILAGAGAAMATGCVIGNILSGVALASVGAVFFTFVVVLANWATTYFYLMGGTLRPSE